MTDWTGTILQFPYGRPHLSTHLHQHTHVTLYTYPRFSLGIVEIIFISIIQPIELEKMEILL